MMLFAVYACFLMTQGCRLINDAKPTTDRAECEATAQRLDKAANHSVTRYRCSKYAGPNQGVPM